MLGLDHVEHISVDCKPSAIKAARANVHSSCHFKYVKDVLSGEEAPCLWCNANCSTRPPPLDLVVARFPCTPYTTQRSTRKEQRCLCWPNVRAAVTSRRDPKSCALSRAQYPSSVQSCGCHVMKASVREGSEMFHVASTQHHAYLQKQDWLSDAPQVV